MFFLRNWILLRLVDSFDCQIMWTEAMGKLEGMESSNRERLWPQLVKGFKDLSERLKVSNMAMSMMKRIT